MTSNKAETWRSLRARMREDAKQNLETLRSRPLKPELLAMITDEERRLLSKRQQFFARKQAIRDERARRSEAATQLDTPQQQTVRQRIRELNAESRRFWSSPSVLTEHGWRAAMEFQRDQARTKDLRLFSGTQSIAWATPWPTALIVPIRISAPALQGASADPGNLAGLV